MSKARSATLLAGYARREITPALGTALAGRPTWLPRRARKIRDPLFVRAVHVRGRDASLTLLSADLALVTRRLAQAAAERASVPADELVICATHTHSATGGYWRGSLVETFMGPYQPEIFDWLASELGAAAAEARQSVAPAALSFASLELPGISTNRRSEQRSVDPTLSVMEFVCHSAKPICLVSFGAHPVAGVEHEPWTVTADYPGELCRRLEASGVRPLFLLGAAGATSPGWLDLPLDEHLARLGDSLEAGVERARSALGPLDGSRLGARSFVLDAEPAPCRLFSDGPRRRAWLELASAPLRALVGTMARQGAKDNASLALHVLGIGELTLLALPCEVGPTVSRALRELVPATGRAVVVSMCNGYTGYVHLAEEYAAPPKPRGLALYENAMSVAGWEFGERIVSLIEQAFRADGDRARMSSR